VSNRGAWSDIRDFLLHTPPVPTLIEFASEEEREDYSHRILQRVGLSVSGYAVLNLHRIGIEAPVRYVFEELLTWDAESTYWPNHLARVERVDGRLEHIEIFLFGRRKPLFGIGNGAFGLDLIPLFRMDALEIARRPDPTNFDNARYLLYRCSGGYPIGIFAIYVRSPIAARGEPEQTQVFFAVGFNFYGKEDWPETHIINSIWERVHNRATANILNKLKELCEGSFRGVAEPPRSRMPPGPRRASCRG